MDFYRPPTIQETVDAIGSVYRALRAWKFYPEGNPTRSNSIRNAHSAMLMMLGGNDLLLSCGRTGFSFPDGERINDAARLANALSYELCVRRIQKITFLHDLYLEDLLDFLKIINLLPETIQKMGGVDKIMAGHGIRSIWVNEFDLSVIRGKRNEVESKGIVPPGLDETEGNGDPTITFEQQPLQDDDLPPEQQLQKLLGRLTTTLDDDIYAILVRQAVICSDALKSRHEPLVIFPLIELLASHAGDEMRSRTMRECDRCALEQLAAGDEFLHCVLDRMGQAGGLSQNALQAVLSTGGSSAVILAVEQIAITNNRAVRKTISALLTGLGEAAVPTLLEMMGDARWYIIRNICAILGSIGSSDAIPGLIPCLRHTDKRVCKEAIRSLAGIGGREAESAIINILRENDTELYPQAMVSLGGMQSKKSLAELMRILSDKDMFLTSLPFKIGALAAIAMIGDRQVTPRLVDLLTERHLLAANRWKQLKVAIAHCLGRLGDVRALPALKGYSANPDELGVACSEAVVLIEKTGGTADGRT